MNLKFIHITKCAGTSIEDAGKQIGLNWGRHNAEYGHHHRPLINMESKFINTYDWFMIVRNPYDRILSEYYCKWGGIGNKQVNHTKEQMNKFLINKIKHISKQDFHYMEQYRYLHPGVKIHILKFENLHAEFYNLMKLYNINNIVLGKTNSKQHNAKFSVADFSYKLIKLINKVYDKDFAYFQYEKILPMNR